MKFTGIIRSPDDLGRFTLPKEIRKQGKIEPGESVEVFIDQEEESIILKKYQRGCIFCDTIEIEAIYKGKGICKNCLTEIKANQNKK